MQPVLVVVLSAITGSLLNVIIWRLPQVLEEYYKDNSSNLAGRIVKSLSLPPSNCPECKTTLGWLELIPIFSYLMQRGKCKSCAGKIPVRYPLVELTSILAAIWCWFNYPPLQAIAIFIFLSALIVLSVIDFLYKILPDEITLPLLWTGLLVNLDGALVPLSASVTGAAAGFLSLWLLYHAHYALRKREGLGHGDFKLFAAIGAWLGWQQLPLVLFTGALAGIVYFGFLMFGKKISSTDPIAFGPFLSFGAWFSLMLPTNKFLTGLLS